MCLVAGKSLLDRHMNEFVKLGFCNSLAWLMSSSGGKFYFYFFWVGGGVEVVAKV